jgi:predicted enzyme related to lactoylglutathione lyase
MSCPWTPDTTIESAADVVIPLCLTDAGRDVRVDEPRTAGVPVERDRTLAFGAADASGGATRRVDFTREGRMRATRIVADLRVANVEAARSFYMGYLGLGSEEFNMGWVARYTSPDTGAIVQLVTRDASAPEDPAISVFTDDVDGAYAEARESGYEIVHPLTKEPWGVRRFFVRAPDGTVVNIVDHRD